MRRSIAFLRCASALGALGLTMQASADVHLPKFPPGAVWNRDISAAPLNANSADMISTLTGLGGFGGGKFQIDFSIVVVHAPDGAVPTKTVIAGQFGSDYYSPDCDAPGIAFPIPAQGMIEGSPTNDYSCDNQNNDCHLLVVQGSTLWEAYAANVTGPSLETICALHWDLAKVYPPEGRGEQCTSVDGAGFPVAPLLFSADDVYAATQVTNGDLGHAIRFVLPNARIAAAKYVHPGTHGTKPPNGASGPTGPSGTIPYASRLRLRGNFNLDNYNPAAQVILRTMQRYGIVLSDGGTIALTAEDDRYNTHSWASLGIDSQVFNPGHGNPAVFASDFAVVETGAQKDVTYDCVRTPDDFIYIDRFDY
jgi:serine/threonine-protein kinase